MSRPVSGEIKTSTSRVRQKNGDIYVYERKMLYKPETCKTVDMGRTLLGKIPNDSTTGEMIPTRPKKPAERKKQTDGTAAEPIVRAQSVHYGLASLLEHIGKDSGITEDLRRSFPDGEAQKIDAIARFWCANQGETLTTIESWQLTHPCSHNGSLGRRVYHELFKYIGEHSSTTHGYFRSRAERCGKFEALALDSTTVSTHSANIASARMGFNKAGDGLKTIKLTTVYALDPKDPVAFLKQPGNIADVSAIERSLAELKWLDMDSIEVVTDKGYYSQDNLAKFLRAHVKFLTSVKLSVGWVKEQLEKHEGALDAMENLCSVKDSQTYGITIPLQKTFAWKRLRGNGQARKGDEQSREFRIYLYLYKNWQLATRMASELIDELRTLKEQLEAGETDFNESALRMIERYFVCSRTGRGGHLKVTPNQQAIDEDRHWFGCFALVSNKAGDASEALRRYRLREKIEEAFKDAKNRFDGHKTRSWGDETLQGRLFCQFVGLGYFCCIKKRIDEVKDKLDTALKIAKSKDGSMEESRVKAYEDLRKWLDENTLQGILKWLDCIDKTTFQTVGGSGSSVISNITKRDILFLSMLGLKEFEPKPIARIVKGSN